MRKNVQIGIAAATLLVIIAAAYFVVMPIVKSGTSGGAVTPAPVTITPVTLPAKTTPPVPARTAVQTTPTPLLIRDDHYELTFEQIYTSTKPYKFGEKTTIPVNLTRPPLYIKFNVTPVLVRDKKLVDIGTSSEHEVIAIYPSPLAWFDISVVDRAGYPVESHGFGTIKGYNVNGDQDFMVRTSGVYDVELSGNEVNVSVRMFIGT